MSSSDLLNDTAHRYPERAALVSGAVRLSYAELHAYVTRCAAGFLQQLAAQGAIHPPAKRGGLVVSGDGGHDEARQMLAGYGFPGY